MIPIHLFDSVEYYFNPHAIALFISAGLIAWLGGKTLSGHHSKTNQYFAAFCFCIIVWLFFTALGYLVKNDAALAMFWFRLDWAGVSFGSVNVYAFAVSFVGEKKPRSISVGYALAFIFAALDLTINPMMMAVRKYYWGFFPLYDRHFSPFFFAFFFGYMMLAFGEFIKAYRRTSDPVKRNQIKYIFSALAIAYLGSVDFLPAFGIAVYPWGFAAISLFVAITAYAILRHHLLDISIVIRRTLVYSVISGGLASVYAGLVTLIARLLENRSIAPALFALKIFKGIFNSSKFYSIGFMVGFISVSCMAILVAWVKPRRHEAMLWSVLSFLVADWFLGRYMIMYASSAEQAFFWQRVMYVGAIYLNVVFYHFVCAF